MCPDRPLKRNGNVTITPQQVLPGSQKIWVTDAELIRRSGVPEKIMRSRLRALDANPYSGFPRKDPTWGDRRHWPSVMKFWEQRAETQNNPQARRPVTFRDRKTA